jgi:CelD/BcsL family acetyltransferase involved in cellulose biosynthesis
MKAALVTPQELDADCIGRWEQLRETNPIYASPFYSPHFALAVGEVRLRAGIAKPIGGHFNDYHGAILEPGLTLADPGLLQSARLDAYDFDHLPSHFGSGLHLTDASQTSPQMDLSNGYDNCIASKGDSWKRGQRDMARKLRKMERELGPLRLESACESEDLFNWHIEMRNALYCRMGLRPDYCTGWEGEVLRGLRMANRPGFRGALSILFAGSRPVAAHFGLVSCNVLHWWFPAYDLAVQRYSPGLQLIDHCAQKAANEGISMIDFGKGDDRYKALFADHNVPMLKGSACRGGSFAARARAGHAAILGIAERVLPATINAYPRKSVERLWTGTTLPLQHSRSPAAHKG